MPSSDRADKDPTNYRQNNQICVFNWQKTIHILASKRATLATLGHQNVEKIQVSVIYELFKYFNKTVYTTKFDHLQVAIALLQSCNELSPAEVIHR